MIFTENIIDSLNNKRALVTGGTGMIGREVVNLLTNAGCEVTSVSLDDLAPNTNAKYIKGDLSDFKFCLEICSGQDLLFHIAGIKGSISVTEAQPASFFVPLLMMNTNILEAAMRTNIAKCLYTSSIGAYSLAEIFVEKENDFAKPPMDMYPGWAKRMAELQIQAYIKEYQVQNFSIVRPSNVYGPGDNFDPENAMVIPSLMAKIVKGDSPVIVWGDGSAERDFLHSRDAAIGIILACVNGTHGMPVNLGCGYGISIRTLVETLQSFIDFEPFFDVSKPSGFPRRIMDMSLAQKMIGFEPQISLSEGLKETWDWYIKNGTQHMNKKNYFRSDL